MSGYLAAPGDIALLARRVLELVRDPALRARMGREGSARAGEWDIDAMVRAQESLYEELIAGRGPAGAARRRLT